MASKKASKSPRQKKTAVKLPNQSPRELILVTRSDTAMRASASGLRSMAGRDVSKLSKTLSDAGASMEPLFGLSEDQMNQRYAALGLTPAAGDMAMSDFYSVVAPEDRFEDLVTSLPQDPLVECAYIKPPAELAAVTEADMEMHMDIESEESINEMQPLAESAPSSTPDFSTRQLYLNSAPIGIDARYAWSIPGGRGAGVRIIDLEWGWRFTHEDLIQNQGGVLAGVNSSNDHHGTAVLGEISGDRNAFGILGIAPDAHVSAVAFSMPTARAIRIAADRLRPGDIMLLEIHRAGPRFAFQGRADQQGYIAVEWWPDDYAAIRYATNRGVIVVEAAGNGRQDFDDRIYGIRPAGFPSTWRNPFDPANLSSMAVLVGAGAPPPGTHGRNHGPDRSRLDFSNYGRRVDAQGWGREVTSTGYGDLQGGSSRDRWYTDTFSGTSSASPIVVGALACMQGVNRTRGSALLTPATAITRLRATGSLQTDAPGRPRTQRIGNRPDLRRLISRRVPVRTTKLHRYWNSRIGDHFYTTNWSELGRGRYGYRYEGVQCHIYSRRISGTVPMFRYWNPRIGDHFYTTNWRELGRGRYGYRYEGVQGYVFARRPRGAVSLYRYWNPRIGDHFYTTNWRELGRGRSGWRYEGVQCFVFPRAVSRMPETATEEPHYMDESAEEMEAFTSVGPDGQDDMSLPSIEPHVMEFIDAGPSPDVDDEFANESFILETIEDEQAMDATAMDDESVESGMTDPFMPDFDESGESQKTFELEDVGTGTGGITINLNFGDNKKL